MAIRALLFVSIATTAWCLPLQATGQDDKAIAELTQLLDEYKAAKDDKRYEEALALSQRMATLAERHLRSRPEMLASYWGLVGDSCFVLKRYDEAIAAFQKGLAYSERAYGTKSEQLVEPLQDLGNSYYNQRQREQALPFYQRALQIRERQRGANHPGTNEVRKDVADTLFALQQYAAAERLYRKCLQIAEADVGADDPSLARWLHEVGDCLWNQNKKDDSLPYYARALAIREHALGFFHEDTEFSRSELVDGYQRLDRSNEAEQVWLDLVTAVEQAQGPEHPDVALALLKLAHFYEQHDQEDQLEPIYERALAIREQAMGPDAPELVDTLHEIGNFWYERRRYEEAEQYHRRGLTIRERTLAADDPNLAYSQTSTALALQMRNRLAEAEALLRRALAIYEQVEGDDASETARCLWYLSGILETQARNVEAEALLRRALAIQEKASDPDDLELANLRISLGSVLRDQGQFAEAETLVRRALLAREQQLDPTDSDVAYALDMLGIIYKDQGRASEAVPLHRRALQILETNLGSEHPDVANLLNNLAADLCDLDQLAESEALHRRALAIWEQTNGPDHPDVAYSLHNIGGLVGLQGRPAEAEPLHRRGLAIRERAFGSEHPTVAYSLLMLGDCLVKLARHTEAEPLVDRAITILERAKVMPDSLLEGFVLRAELSWQAGRRPEALADLRRAMELAEQLRGQAGGGEQERARQFGQYSAVFEKMVSWQVELGDVGEALSALERGRARSLLDELNLGGADVEAGRSALERETARRRESALQATIAQLEEQLTNATTDEDRNRLRAELEQARGALYDHYREQRSTSVVYRNLLAVGGGTLRLSQLQRRLAANHSHLLAYLLGEDGGYLLSIGADRARIVSLSVDEPAARTLRTTGGPFTAARAREVLLREDGQGVVQQLAAAKTAPPTTGLFALWQLLVPEAERQLLLDSQLKGLIVIPDGPLALLPFETLVVQPGTRPRYLLDAGPPVLYGPSATVLYNLFERPLPAAVDGREPILTVGDPVYHAPGEQPAAEPAASAASSPGSRYAAARGLLASLPNTALEANWVVDAFGRRGIAAARLVRADATEEHVRTEMPGRRVVHLACHGLADQSFGNFFGALALTPGPAAATDAANDGFLTLAEIYGLNLRSCELAILSACETNYGPQQLGEGVWALSRGFLVAGSRRVVASNWLVDDAAAASLISYYCGGLAEQAAAANATTDYARALQAAKRWIRDQKKWENPYYWATFVLVGPN